MDHSALIEREFHFLVVFAPNPDPVVAAKNVNVLRLIGKFDLVGECAETVLHLVVSPCCRKPRLLLHCIAQAIVRHGVLAHEGAEVDEAGEDDDLYETAKAARAPAGRYKGPAGHYH